MIIAIPYDEETKGVFPATGATEVFYFAEADRKSKTVLREGFAETEGRTHHQLPLFLASQHTDVRICNHLGRPLLELRKQNGRKVYLTPSNSISETISLFRTDQLPEADEASAHDCHCEH